MSETNAITRGEPSVRSIRDSWEDWRRETSGAPVASAEFRRRTLRQAFFDGAICAAMLIERGASPQTISDDAMDGRL